MEWNEEPMGEDDDRAVPMGRRPRQRRQGNPMVAENARRQQEARMAGGSPMAMPFNPMMGLASPADQARTLQGMANTVMAAHSKEMDGRRASFREARRLQHERDMLLLRLQAERDARLGR